VLINEYLSALNRNKKAIREMRNIKKESSSKRITRTQQSRKDDMSQKKRVDNKQGSRSQIFAIGDEKINDA
jgi:hypothetical protein